MANQIQATVYQIDGNPQAASITVDFLTSELVITEASVSTIPSVNSAIYYYNVVNNQQSVQTYYAGETVAALVALANNGETSHTQATVLEINGNPQVSGGVQYSFPSAAILIGESINPSSGVNAFIQYKGVRYYTSESQKFLYRNSNSANIVISKLCTIPAGSSIVDSSEKLGYTSAIYNYAVSDCTNKRAGTITIIWDKFGNIDWNEVSTVDIGDTSGVVFSANQIGNNTNLVGFFPSSIWKFSFSKIVLPDCCSFPYYPNSYITSESGENIITENSLILITE